ncbi:hypothetical protein [Dipodfec virus UOA04_Rod_499]|nr:hypothetical protein [Dipodfec virus UOA04_Rod_499]
MFNYTSRNLLRVFSVKIKFTILINGNSNILYTLEFRTSPVFDASFFNDLMNQYDPLVLVSKDFMVLLNNLYLLCDPSDFFKFDELFLLSEFDDFTYAFIYSYNINTLKIK